MHALNHSFTYFFILTIHHLREIITKITHMLVPFFKPTTTHRATTRHNMWSVTRHNLWSVTRHSMWSVTRHAYIMLSHHAPNIHSSVTRHAPNIHSSVTRHAPNTHPLCTHQSHVMPISCYPIMHPSCLYHVIPSCTQYTHNNAPIIHSFYLLLILQTYHLREIQINSYQ